MIFQEEIFRPRRWAAIIIALCPLVLAPFINVNDRRQLTMIGVFTGACLVIGLVVYIVMSRIAVRIDSQGISYRNILGERTIRWNEIESAAVIVRHAGKNTHREIVLRPLQGKPLALKTGLYSRRNLHAISSALVQEARHARIDDTVQGFAIGRFPWYIR